MKSMNLIKKNKFPFKKAKFKKGKKNFEVTFVVFKTTKKIHR